jgi:hypothetical protein
VAFLAEMAYIAITTIFRIVYFKLKKKIRSVHDFMEWRRIYDTSRLKEAPYFTKIPLLLLAIESTRVMAEYVKLDIFTISKEYLSIHLIFMLFLLLTYIICYVFCPRMVKDSKSNEEYADTKLRCRNYSDIQKTLELANTFKEYTIIRVLAHNYRILNREYGPDDANSMDSYRSLLIAIYDHVNKRVGITWKLLAYSMIFVFDIAEPIDFIYNIVKSCEIIPPN